MVSVRLTPLLEKQLAVFCERQQVSKSSVVQLALEKYLSLVPTPARAAKVANPFAALRGTGNCKLSASQIMQVTRGDDWNKSCA
jgi:hypothetical protein